MSAHSAPLQKLIVWDRAPYHCKCSHVVGGKNVSLAKMTLEQAKEVAQRYSVDIRPWDKKEVVMEKLRASPAALPNVKRYLAERKITDVEVQRVALGVLCAVYHAACCLWHGVQRQA